MLPPLFAVTVGERAPPCPFTVARLFQNAALGPDVRANTPDVTDVLRPGLENLKCLKDSRRLKLSVWS